VGYDICKDWWADTGGKRPAEFDAKPKEKCTEKRICTGCKRVLLVSDFRKRKDGANGQCKYCEAAQQRKYRKARRERDHEDRKKEVKNV